MTGIHRVTKLFPWQTSWAATFLAEQKLIIDAIASAGFKGDVFHVGSTSVQGMISKPIIDILVCAEKKTPIDQYVPLLEKIGYFNLGECGRAGRLFFSKGNEENNTFYLHLCREDNQVAVDQKLFQFIERNDPSVFSQYVRLKQSLASVFPLDRDLYRATKGLFIDGVLSAYRLGRTHAESCESGITQEDNCRIKYWIYEFEMPEKTKQEYEILCAQHEMTPDEFFQIAILNEIHSAEADQSGYHQHIIGNSKGVKSDVKLIRYYPVFKGETEAQARKRKFAEEMGMEKETDNNEP